MPDTALQEMITPPPILVPIHAPVQPESFLARVGKLALIVGLIGLVIGAFEGLAVGSFISSGGESSSSLSYVLAVDRGILMGIVEQASER